MPPHRQDASARPAPAGSPHTPTDGATLVATGWLLDADDATAPQPQEAAPEPEAADAAAAPAVPEVGCPTAEGQIVLYAGKTTASYFWDDGSGVNGDTGAPASGEPMQKGLAASPSWPMGTKGYVIYKGKKADFFIGDRGPGVPSSSGVMLDLDGKTFAELTGGTWNTDSLTVEDAGGLGHIPVKYVITQWGKGLGKTGAPKPFSTGAYGVKDHPEPPPPCPTETPAPAASAAASQDSAPTSTPGVKESPAPVASPAVASPSAAPAVPASPASPDTQAEAASAGMSPLAGTAAAKAAQKAAQKTAETAGKAGARTAAETVKGARTGEATASPAFTPASAVDGQLEEAAVPAFSVAIVVCALVAVGAKAVLSRPAHATAHQQGRHRKR
ncbi:hypothetical protein Msi02_12290 [Microbispora siamensis]|uniref:Htaa protein n=1 Tax=Microbispora siamensis TaxID=564413 RepID=A0ABQ4GG50_9ACTN|nr:hypothetical protein Msi02_12290 [Microbispora siamensis]